MRTALLGADQIRVLEDADVLEHTRHGHRQRPRQLADRSRAAAEALEDVPAGRIRDGVEPVIERGTLNHLVIYRRSGDRSSTRTWLVTSSPAFELSGSGAG